MSEDHAARWVHAHPGTVVSAVLVALATPAALRLWQGIRTVGGQRPAVLSPVPQQRSGSAVAAAGTREAPGPAA